MADSSFNQWVRKNAETLASVTSEVGEDIITITEDLSKLGIGDWEAGVLENGRPYFAISAGLDRAQLERNIALIGGRAQDVGPLTLLASRPNKQWAGEVKLNGRIFDFRQVPIRLYRYPDGLYDIVAVKESLDGEDWLLAFQLAVLAILGEELFIQKVNAVDEMRDAQFDDTILLQSLSDYVD
jgi:hypothetical protein